MGSSKLCGNATAKLTGQTKKNIKKELKITNRRFPIIVMLHKDKKSLKQANGNLCLYSLIHFMISFLDVKFIVFTIYPK